jgi:hypothetical protein
LAGAVGRAELRYEQEALAEVLLMHYSIGGNFWSREKPATGDNDRISCIQPMTAGKSALRKPHRSRGHQVSSNRQQTGQEAGEYRQAECQACVACKMEQSAVHGKWAAGFFSAAQLYLFPF